MSTAGQLTMRLVRYNSAEESETDSLLSGNTLVRLGYNNSATASFVAPSTYDSDCPAKNNPLPGQGAF